VLGIIVVPRHTVERQKRKELVTISLQPLFEFCCYFALQGYICNLSIKSIHSRKMPPQEAAFEAESIDGFQQGRKS